MWDTLLGGLLVIAGGALGIGGNYWIETRRWRREDEYRDYADRRHVYTEFVTSWFSYEEVKHTRLRDEAGRKALEVAQLQLQRSFNALSLLAPEEVRAGADGILKEALGVTDGGATVGARKKKEGAPGRFWKAARKDLGKELPRPLEKADDEGDR